MNAGTYPNFGYTDWRLPNRKELFSMKDRTQYDFALPSGHPFTIVRFTFGYWCWSSTTYAYDTGNTGFGAWISSMSYGDGVITAKNNNVEVWPVRGGMITSNSIPTGLTATADFGQIILSWDNIPGAISYNIYWSTSPGVTKETGIQISGINNTSYTHTGLSFLKRYYYVVTAVNSFGESIESSEVSAKPKFGTGEF
jgi:hypothetical protein